MPPWARVATQMLPLASTAREVEALVGAAGLGEQAAAVGRGPGLPGEHPGLQDVERPEARGLGLGDVERLAVGRQADAVRGHHREGDLADQRAVGLGVEHRAIVHLALAPLAEVGEVEAAMGVEHDVVGAAQLDLVGAAVEHLDRAGLEVDALDPAARIVPGLDAPAAGRARSGRTRSRRCCRRSTCRRGRSRRRSARRPGVATTSLRPSGRTRVSERRAISTSRTEPSGIAIGPSGNNRPVVISRSSGIGASSAQFGRRYCREPGRRSNGRARDAWGAAVVVR